MREDVSWDVRFPEIKGQSYLDFLQTTDDTRLLVAHSDHNDLSVRIAVARNPNMPPQVIHAIVTGKSKKGERKVVLRRRHEDGSEHLYEVPVKVKREKDMHVILEYAKNPAMSDGTVLSLISRVLSEEPYEPPFFDGTNWSVRPEQEIRREILLTVLARPGAKEWLRYSIRFGGPSTIDVLAMDEDDAVSKAAIAMGGELPEESPEEKQAREEQAEAEVESRELQGVFENPFESRPIMHTVPGVGGQMLGETVTVGDKQLGYAGTYREGEYDDLVSAVGRYKEQGREAKVFRHRDKGQKLFHLYVEGHSGLLEPKLSTPLSAEHPGIRTVRDAQEIWDARDKIEDDIAFLLGEKSFFGEQAYRFEVDAKLLSEKAASLFAESQSKLAEARAAEPSASQPRTLALLKLGRGKHQLKTFAERQRQTLERAAELREDVKKAQHSYEALMSRIHDRYPEGIAAASPGLDPQARHWYSDAMSIKAEIDAAMMEISALESEAAGVESVAAGTSGGMAMESARIYEKAANLRAEARELHRHALETDKMARDARLESESAAREATKYDLLADRYGHRLDAAKKFIATQSWTRKV